MTQQAFEYTEARQRPATDCDRVLEVLLAHRGCWVDRPYRRLQVMWHSRVADLRKRGHIIESRVVPVEGQKPDHQYRWTGRAD